MKILKSPSSQALLNRILADPGLPEKIKSLDPRELAALIDRVGLEDCGEIVAFASTQQLEQMFDQDVWRSAAPGADEEFDAARFGLWIEILLELGAPAAAKTIGEMDPDFLTMAFSQLVWVTEFDWLRDQSASETRLDKIMESSLSYEIEDFILFSRDPRSWDAVLTLIAELDSDNHSFMNRILERCAHLSLEQIDDEGGLWSVLSSEQQIKSDVAYEREKRRETQGFVSPADARAFLKLAAGPLDMEDHVSPARFRDHVHLMTSTRANGANEFGRAVSKMADSRFARVQAILMGSPTDNSPHFEELNYLANVLVSGWEINGRSPRPGEAVQVVLETCEKGLTSLPGARSFIEAFRAGWSQNGFKL
ncbi:MAG: hypothetical protein A2X94_09105 [Bdellovibrionales bacterium GWB1_55_8]|nr:MAG: hypothetical protein A2X94_09105 [Bdellovibrionales bacterium GWB1_55_8]